MRINRFLWNSLSESEKEKIFSRSQTDIREVLPAVQKIIDEVRCSGDSALLRFSQQWDHVDLGSQPLRVQAVERAAKLHPPAHQLTLGEGAAGLRRLAKGLAGNIAHDGVDTAIREGQEVEFVVTNGAKGLQADEVVPL